MLGTLGEIVFETSAEKLLTFRDLSRTGEARVEEHAVIGRKPVIEYIGPALDKVSLMVRLDVAHGVIPRDEIKRLRDSLNAGEVLPLTIGGEFFGDWIITQITEGNHRMDNRGNVLIAEVTISLTEVAE